MSEQSKQKAAEAPKLQTQHAGSNKPDSAAATEPEPEESDVSGYLMSEGEEDEVQTITGVPQIPRF